MKVHRRNLLAGLALPLLKAQPPGQPPSESLYIPKAHLVEDRKFLHDFMDEFSFVDLVTPKPTLRISHIPCFLKRDEGKFGTIYGHVSKHNVQSEAFDSKQDAVIVFRGPHGYISPSWYSKMEAVPTWNFGVIHATGKLRPVSERKPLHDLLAQLIDKNEDYSKSKYSFAKLPDAYKTGLMAGIIGFTMEVELLEGKFKLGQERNEVDQAGILKGLDAAKPERGLREISAAFYKRPK